MATYVAQPHKDADSAFGLGSVDFPGCAAAGGTLRDPARAGTEAPALHVVGMREDGGAIPMPTSLDACTADVANDPRLPILLIEIAPTSARAVRVNVTLPEDVLRDIDRVTNNRSRSLVDAARANAARGAGWSCPTADTVSSARSRSVSGRACFDIRRGPATARCRRRPVRSWPAAPCLLLYSGDRQTSRSAAAANWRR